MPQRSSLAVILVAGLAGIAHADSAGDPGAVPATPSTTSVAPEPMPAPATGARLRNGFSLSLGQELGSGPSDGLSGQMYGVDWRIGAKLNRALSFYMDTHLSFGTAKIGAASGATSNFATALNGEYELPQRAFFGGGLGYGVLNNPSGPLAQLRVGYYPFAHDAAAAKTRRLNVALDARFYFPGDAIGRVSQYSVSLGYDRF